MDINIASYNPSSVHSLKLGTSSCPSKTRMVPRIHVLSENTMLTGRLRHASNMTTSELMNDLQVN